ncbi:MAG: hypothetical protein IMX00_04955 [Limnochordales bacterium]|nr:hypothetical protein [Limnochordales bacterium]
MFKQSKLRPVSLFAILAVAMALVAALFAATQVGNADDSAASAIHSEDGDARAVAALVEDFGRRLQLVSLLAPTESLAKTMQEHYGNLVASPELIDRWLDNPLHAPGRLTSSPWPDRIEITSIEKLSERSYRVEGKIIEITSTEMQGSGVAAQRPITLLVERVADRWLISDVTVGEETDHSSLPASWEGYQVIAGKWEGYSLEESGGNSIAATGPMISSDILSGLHKTRTRIFPS